MRAPARTIEEDAAELLAAPPLPEEVADRERLMLFVVSRLRMGTPPSDIEVEITPRDLNSLTLRHEGRHYQVLLARIGKD